jgi:hypothetical protein
MPIPIVIVEYTDGTTESFYVPLRMMSFQKKTNPSVKNGLSGGLGHQL